MYLLWRAPEWGLLHGIPLTPVSTAALFVVWWIWSIGRRVPAVGWVVLLLLAKVFSGPLLVPRGLHASYFSNGSWQPPAERGLHGATLDETRIDSRIAFGTGRRGLPVYFLNDTRFNRPGATREPLSVEWTGYTSVLPGDTDLRLFISGRGVTAEAQIDGFTVVTLGPDEVESTGQVRVRPGLRRLNVRLSSPSGIPDAFQAGIVDSASGGRRAFADSDIFQHTASSARLASDRWLRSISQACDLAALAMLALAGLASVRGTLAGSWSLPSLAGNRVIRVVPLVAFAEALWFAREAWNRVEVLGWGTDRLAYESAAREIIFRGPLMTLGAPLGQGLPFYYQPLYSYFLALTHAITGEGLWGVYLCQRLGLAVVAYAIWSMADVLFGAPTALAALILGLWFAFVRLHDFSAALYTESLFIPLLCVWTLWLCREAAKPGTRKLITGAVAGGLATLSRSTLLAAWAPVAALLTLVYRRAQRPVLRLAALLALMALVVGLATVRNAIVSGRFVAISSSLADNLYMGNAPPGEAPLAHERRHTWMEWLTREERTRLVLEYAYHSPGDFTRGLLRKAAYVLGLESTFNVTRPAKFVTAIAIDATLPWIWMAALLGGALAIRPRRPEALAQLVPAMVALSHFAAVVAIFPYSERLVLPFYVLLVPYAAVPFGVLASRLGAGRLGALTSRQ